MRNIFRINIWVWFLTYYSYMCSKIPVIVCLRSPGLFFCINKQKKNGDETLTSGGCFGSTTPASIEPSQKLPKASLSVIYCNAFDPRIRLSWKTLHISTHNQSDQCPMGFVIIWAAIYQIYPFSNLSMTIRGEHNFQYLFINVANHGVVHMIRVLFSEHHVIAQMLDQ